VKRGMTGGAHRGPVALRRQRRTIRLVQVLLVLGAAALLVFAGYSMGRGSGFDAARRATALEPPRPPSVVQTLVLAVLGLGALAAALSLQGAGGVRIPTPARLEELTGRAEAVAVERAERSAGESTAEKGVPG
jgi:hypothetical protein